MKKVAVVSIRDRAANAFTRPIFVASIGQALRSFQDEINRPGENNEMNRHPDDFDLYYIADFNEDSGTFENVEGGPKQVAIGKQMKNP